MINDVVLEGIVVQAWKYADGLLFRLACYRARAENDRAVGMAAMAAAVEINQRVFVSSGVFNANQQDLVQCSGPSKYKKLLSGTIRNQCNRHRKKCECGKTNSAGSCISEFTKIISECGA